MNGQFIGTANTNELEELQDDNQAGAEMEGLQNLNESSEAGANQEEMVLLEDDNEV